MQQEGSEEPVSLARPTVTAGHQCLQQGGDREVEGGR